MTREEAARMLMKFADACSKCDLTSKTPYIPAFRIGAAALRGPQPDPDTGMVPCGCGGKAEIGQYCEVTEVTCDKCGASVPVNYTEVDAKAAWNRAMGGQP